MTSEGHHGNSTEGTSNDDAIEPLLTQLFLSKARYMCMCMYISMHAMSFGVEYYPDGARRASWGKKSIADEVVCS